MMESNKIYQGDALSVLKTFPNESINCVMTSPPYWALRDYGSSVETIWDEKEGCEHNFEIKERHIHRGSTDVENSIHGAIHNENLKVDWKTKDGFCSLCGAWKGQLGLEPTFDLYIKHLCDIFDEVKRVLRKDGTCWVNMGDTYASTPAGNKEVKFGGDGVYGRLMQRNTQGGKEDVTWKPNKSGVQDKCLCMIPQRFAIEMCNRGWVLRNVIIWHKPNCMPSSVKDRFTVDFEYLFFFVKNKKYWFETQYEPIKSINDRRVDKGRENHIGKSKEGVYGCNATVINSYGRNKRAVWSICPKPFKESHFAVYPEELCDIPIKSGCPENGIVLDIFMGSGTTGLSALKQNKRFIGIELNPKYIEIANNRLKPFLEQTKLIREEKND